MADRGLKVLSAYYNLGLAERALAAPPAWVGAADPDERRNLAGDAAHADTLAGLRARLADEERRLGPRRRP